MMIQTPLNGAVWVHAGLKPPDHIGRVATAAGGVVLQGPPKYRQAREVLESGIPAMLQHDADLEPAPQPTLFGPDESWLSEQHSCVVVSSRAGWVPPPSTEGRERLRQAVLTSRTSHAHATRSEPSRPFVAMVALSHKWLTSRESRREVISALRSVGAPIGLMLEKAMDPLDTVQAVEGLVTLVTELESVAVFRCDHGALGAMAFGATGGSIGIGTSTRHFLDPDDNSWADFTDRTPRVFLPFIMGWWKGSRLAYYEEDPMFRSCSCPVCRGASLARFQDEALRAEADAHSVACWADLARRLQDEDPGHRADAWLRLCQTAYDNLDAIEDTSGLLQAPSRQLKAWLRFAGVPAV
ncbi:MAG: hypothetical protein KY469_09805 [Actinobacteria bacterium]|nr:hypothetical protein [Actinomycetota bacterium]